jgi:TrmH family RNA methyltransferase
MGTVMAKSLVTLVRSLKVKRGRERRGLALAEGVRLVEEVLEARVPVKGVVYSPALETTPRGRALKTALASQGVPLGEVAEKTLDELADTEHPQGIVAVVEPRAWKLEDLSLPPRSLVLVLDGVQDPGNVGAMLRTAHALGAAGAVALKGTADPTNPKVLRSSMGAIFHFPVVAAEDATFLAWVKQRGLELLVAEAAGAPISGTPRPGPIALVMGNEGAGIRPAMAKAAAGRVAIPMPGGAESLNVAVAAGILLWEMLRES